MRFFFCFQYYIWRTGFLQALGASAWLQTLKTFLKICLHQGIHVYISFVCCAVHYADCADFYVAMRASAFTQLSMCGRMHP